MGMSVGSLFSGAGGLDLAVEAVFGGRTVWHCEQDVAASKVLAHRWPGVPNLGDITSVDWAAVEPVDVLCGGFPCQDVSSAGRRAGIKDGTRSGLWSYFADAIDQLRPRLVVVENVRGLLSATAHRTMESDDAVVGDGSGGPVLRAIGAVLGDLADIGYDAQWSTVAAADVGAPHRRERVFILAVNATREPGSVDNGDRLRARRPAERRRPDAGRGSAADSDMRGCQVGTKLDSGPTQNPPHRHPQGRHLDRRDLAVADASGDRRDEGWPESAGLIGRPDAAIGGHGPVELLPTPRARDHKGRANPPGRVRDGRLRTIGDDALPDAVHDLLPTPRRSDGDGGPNPLSRAERMDDVETRIIRLLQTPSAADGDGSRKARGGARGNEPLLPGQAVEMAQQWGKYAPAIHRWEALTRPAPPPTEPNTKGNPRLAAAFAEWMQGWPAGWVIGPAIGISRNDQLRVIGNGVVPQQAIAALRQLLIVAESLGVA